MRILTLSVASAALLAPAARAQSIFDSELRVAPQYMQYHVGTPSNETISQVAIPLYFTIPVSSRLTVDVGTSYAHSLVTGDNGRSELNGLTDTQVRGNLTLGTDYLVLTAGLNLPTGKTGVTLDQFAVAKRISSDFLAFPIASMGTGFAGTGGIAVARPFGDWNLGAGAAIRRATSYEPFNIPDQSMRLQPGNEYRVRVGVDRLLGAGRLALGLTFSRFGEDQAAGSSFTSGNRTIGQVVYNTNVGGNDAVLGAYDVYRGAGELATGIAAGHENVANLFGSVSLRSGDRLVEPTVELRHWLQGIPATSTTDARTQNSVLASLGVRTRLDVAGLTVYPGVGVTLGRLAVPDASGAPTTAGLTGFKAQIAMRAAPFAGQ